MEPTAQEPNNNMQAEVEASYNFLQKKGLSEVEILQFANDLQELAQLLLQDCKNEGEITPSTVDAAIKLKLKHNPQLTKERVTQEAEYMARRENCKGNLLQEIVRDLGMSTQLKEFAQQKLNTNK